MKKVLLIIFAFFASTTLMAGITVIQPILQVTTGNIQVGILGKTVSPQNAFIDTGQNSTLVADNSDIQKTASSSSIASFYAKASDATSVENCASGTASTLVVADNSDIIFAEVGCRGSGCASA